MNPALLNVVLIVPVFLFSLCVHEYAHAWVAVRLGDKTPIGHGRLTMDPMAHADLIGTILLPIMCVYLGWPFFGWAKPVSVDMRNLKRGRRDMALVASAGPAANFFMAAVMTGILAWLIRIPMQHTVLDTLQTISVVMIQVNLMLGFFNLLPFPPLDGFAVVQGFLSAKQLVRFQSIARYSDLLLLILLVSGGLAVVSRPVRFCAGWLCHVAGL